MRLRKLLTLMVVVLGAQALWGQQSYHKAAHDLQPDKEFDNVLVQKLASDVHASVFVIWVKHNVPLHKHAVHSETVVILEGKAEMTLGDRHMTVRKGDVIFIPHDTPHSVAVQKGVLKVLSVQGPEFDGTDRVPLD